MEKRKLMLFVGLFFVCTACVRIPTEPMNTGMQVTNVQMERVVDHKTTSEDLIKMIGHPQRQTQLGDKTLWYYDFTSIAQSFGGGKNISETTVFELDKNSIVTSHYKTAGSGGSSSNALLKAAGQ